MAGTILTIRRWGYFLAAAVLAAFTAGIAIELAAGPQSYSELIVGSITWRGASKTQDYTLLLLLVGAFFTWVAVITGFAAHLRRSQPVHEEGFHDSLLLACTPAGLWLTGLLTTKDRSLTLLYVAAVLILFTLVITFLLSRKGTTFWSSVPGELAEAVHRVLLFLVLAPLAAASAAAGANRIGALLHSRFWFTSKKVLAVCPAALVVAAVLILVLSMRARTARDLLDRLRLPVFAVQAVLPASFLLVLPNPWVVDARLALGYHISPWAWAFIGVCAIGAWLELWHKRTVLSDDANPGVSDLLTVGSVVAVIFLFKAQAAGVPGIAADDYHEGELLVPWWSLAKFHLLPFWDYAPARGLVNYVWGAILDLFLDGKASSLPAMWPFVQLAMLFLAALALCPVLGKPATALALFLFPYFNGLSEIDVGVTAFLCLLAMGFLRWRPARWLGAWGAAGVALVLWGPGQGGLAIIATMPLGFWMARRAWMEEPARLRVLAAALLVVGVAFLITPIGQILWGALRYGSEQSSVNSIAHGINWSESFGRADANPWLFEIMRTSWLLVAAWAGVLVLRWLWERDRSQGSATFAYAVPLLILSVLYIFRAAGRIDWVGASRLGIASGWMLALLLPLLVFATRGRSHPGTRTLVWSTLAGLVIPAFGGVPTSLADRFQPLPDPRSAPTFVQQVPALPSIGSGHLNEEHTKRLVTLKRMLDTVLDADETYLDASGRHATYFYFDRRPVIETGSVYNLVTEKQQQRAIAALRTTRAPLVLIGADNIVWDGGPSSLRSHLLYRYLLLYGGYKVAVVDNYVWLIDPARLSRLSGLNVQSVSDVDDHPGNPLLQVFTPGNLEHIPRSWGQSFASLERQLRLVGSVDSKGAVFAHAVERTQDGAFAVKGDDPHVAFDVTKLGLDGQDAGILAFDFSCKHAGPSPVVEIYWGSEGKPESESAVVRFSGDDGRVLVPLDAFPSWLLAKRIRTLRFDVQAKESCSTFRVDNIQIYQRKAADVLRAGLLAQQNASGS